MLGAHYSARLRAESDLQLQLSSAALAIIQEVVLADDSPPAIFLMMVISDLIWLPCIHRGEMSCVCLVANNEGNVAFLWQQGPAWRVGMERGWARASVCACVLISMTCPFSRWGSREMAGVAARPWRTGSGEIRLSLSPNSQWKAWQVAAVGIPHSTLRILV